MTKLTAKTQKLLLFLIFNFVVVIVAFILIEGLSSTVLFVEDISDTKPLAEKLHTKYDAELGWVNLPNVNIEDMYGPGIHFKTNAQGFRNNDDFEVEAPDDKLRVICSGDSFTLGYGVDNNHTWCQLLASMDHRLQTVNMGQGGYGVDQAYLWYKRDGTSLEHDIHLFAFVTSDFKRMRRDTFEGYGKPLIKVQDNALVIDNIPVPRRAYYVPWVTSNREIIDELRSVQLLHRVFFQHNADVEEEEASTDAGQEAPPEFVAAKILEDLQRINTSRNSTLILVYLPLWGDYQPDEKTDLWREYVRLASERTETLFVDLVDEFRKLPAGEVQAMFISDDDIDFPGAAGHYTVKGNKFVAEVLYDKLVSFPEVSAKFDELK
jgi:hypothetical protein